MCHEHTARALIELLEVGKTPPGPDPVLHHAPETLNGIQMMSASRWQKMQMKLLWPVLKRRRELVRPMDTTAIDYHDDLFPSAAKDSHYLMKILAKPLGIKMGDDFIEDFRGPILDGPKHTEPHATRHTAPGAIAYPCVPFESLLTSDLTSA